MIQIFGNTTAQNSLNGIWRTYVSHPASLPLSFNLQDSELVGGSGQPIYNFGVPARIEQNAVMFVGMNPSYVPGRNNGGQNYTNYWIRLSRGVIDYLTGWQYEEFYDPNSVFYKLPYFSDLRKIMFGVGKYKQCSYNVAAAAEISTHVLPNGAADFDTQEEFPNEIKTALRYAHLDLLCARITTQNDLIKDIDNYYVKQPYQQFVDFINAQLGWFADKLIDSEPRVIVVNNAQVSKVFRNDSSFFQQGPISSSTHPLPWYDQFRGQLGIKMEWNYTDHVYHLKEIKDSLGKVHEVDIPVILCGMTTGGHLDNGMREFLISKIAHFA